MNQAKNEKLLEQQPSRFVVGIDLGTTNSAVAYVDTMKKKWRVETFPVPQLVAPGQVESREVLPSFHYQPATDELASGAIRLPWQGGDPEYAVGVLARDHGGATPGRLIVSAKSWLCHSGVDRTAPLLPWHGAPDADSLSPVEASSRYLDHVHQGWNDHFPNERLEDQDVVVTLPASFDEVARELTVEAAARAGLKRIVLIEEPQAAFYAWLHRHDGDWQEHVTPGQKILVCDIGGGTSDFTLIRVRPGEEGTVRFHRVAVGDHLILGGDNLDLALARHFEERLGGNLSPREWSVLVRTCRQVKESMLGADAPEKLTVNIGGGGSRLIGGGRQIDVTRDEVRQLLLDGFFPQVPLDERPTTGDSGFREFGLPYAPDPAVTRWLASFLTAHRHVQAADEEKLEGNFDPARPDIVLFNGGLFSSEAIRSRMLESIESWFRSENNHGKADPDWTPLVLAGEDLYLAVAHGAAYYGMVRRGEGVRISAGLARTYYIGVETDDGQPMAVCLAPAGIEPGRDVELPDRQFALLVSQPVEFPFYVSSTRLTDRPGEMIPFDRETMKPLPPIRTVLQTGSRRQSGTVKVNLHARLTEIGTVDLWCSQVDGPRSWRLQCDVRSATQTDIEAHQSQAEHEGLVDEALWHQCRRLLHGVFGSDATLAEEQAADEEFETIKPQKLVYRLAKATGMERNEWPSSLLRRMWDELMTLEQGRRRSGPHESRWLNLLGYSLRPGYGLAMDDWRVAETWRNVQGKVVHGGGQCRIESWILWRRIGGGLSAGQQSAIADPLLVPIRGLHHRMTTGRGQGGDPGLRSQESIEAWRLLGSLELLGQRTKIELGNILADLLAKKKMESVRPALAWALGRIGSRVPVYGPLNAVPPSEAIKPWIAGLLESKSEDPAVPLALMQLARRTDDRYRDIPDKQRNQVIDWLEDHDAPAHYIDLVRQAGQLDEEEQDRVFGEALPRGLRLV